MQGPRPDHDIMAPAVFESLSQEARAAPGPDTPNVYQLAPPCTTYSDWQLENGGRRTFAHPDGVTEAEKLGDAQFDAACDLAEDAWNNGKEFLLESSAPSCG